MKSQQQAFTPLYDRVIVKRDDAPEQIGSIIIPDVAREKMQRGIVHACGDGRISDLTNEVRTMKVKPGDRIIFGKYTGDEIDIDGEHFIMMREDQIYGIINEPAKGAAAAHLSSAAAPGILRKASTKSRKRK